MKPRSSTGIIRFAATIVLEIAILLTFGCTPFGPQQTQGSDRNLPITAEVTAHIVTQPGTFEWSAEISQERDAGFINRSGLVVRIRILNFGPGAVSLQPRTVTPNASPPPQCGQSAQVLKANFVSYMVVDRGCSLTATIAKQGSETPTKIRFSMETVGEKIVGQ